jgi:hypothetical protein
MRRFYSDQVLADKIAAEEKEKFLVAKQSKKIKKEEKIQLGRLKYA